MNFVYKTNKKREREKEEKCSAKVLKET